MKHSAVMEDQQKRLQQAEHQLLATALSSALTFSHDNLYQVFTLAFSLQLERDRQQEARLPAEGDGGQVPAGNLRLSTSRPGQQVSADRLILAWSTRCQAAISNHSTAAVQCC
jgi:hypothetical protein